MAIVLYLAIGFILWPVLSMIVGFLKGILEGIEDIEADLAREAQLKPAEHHPGFTFDMRLSKEVNYHRAVLYVEEHAPYIDIDLDYFDARFDEAWKEAVDMQSEGAFADARPEDFINEE